MESDKQTQGQILSGNGLNLKPVKDSAEPSAAPKLDFANVAPTTKQKEPVAEKAIPKPKPAQPKDSTRDVGMFSISSLLLLLIVFFLTLYSGYLYWQNQDLANEKQTLATTVTQLRGQQDATESKASITTKAKFFEGRDADRIFWTNFINQTMLVIPQSASSQARSGNLLSILANDRGSVTMSFESSDASQDPFFDTALLIQTLRNQNYLEDVFIPAISARTNELGRKTLSYTITASLIADELRIGLTDEEDLFTNQNSSPAISPTEPPPVNEDALREQIESLQDRVEASSVTETVTEPTDPEPIEISNPLTTDENA